MVRGCGTDVDLCVVGVRVSGESTFGDNVEKLSDVQQKQGGSKADPEEHQTTALIWQTGGLCDRPAAYDLAKTTQSSQNTDPQTPNLVRS